MPAPDVIPPAPRPSVGEALAVVRAWLADGFGPGARLLAETPGGIVALPAPPVSPVAPAVSPPCPQDGALTDSERAILEAARRGPAENVKDLLGKAGLNPRSGRHRGLVAALLAAGRLVRVAGQIRLAPGT